METLQLNSFSRAVHHLNFGRKQPFPPAYRRWRIPAVTKTTRPAGELSAQDLFELFLQERKITGDFVSKTSDMLWKKEVLEVEESRRAEVKEKLQQPQKITDDESGGGFLKLSRTRKWVSGDGEVPVNETAATAEWKTDRENRKRMGLLEYEATTWHQSLEGVLGQAIELQSSSYHVLCLLKRELLLITAGIAAACSGYCFFIFSPQVAFSYAVGAVASFLYLQLLYHHTDNISKEKLAEVFTRRRIKKIGIRSDDLRDSFEKTVRGSALALSSPRLVIPAAIFGFWALSKHYFGESFDFQLAPAVLGLFAYKGAALVQAYRDNEDLLIIFPKDEEI